MTRRAGVTLRSVLFHHIAERDSTFTAGLGVRMGIDDFRARIVHFSERYQPVSFEDVRAAAQGEPLPPRALLVTFDDAYASVAETAASVLEDHRVPSVFFVNGEFLDHRGMNIDNLVTHTANTVGPAALERAVSTIRPDSAWVTRATILAELIPTLRLTEVDDLRRALRVELDHDPLERAAAERLYLTSDQLMSLPEDMVIGSHTSSHVRCRALDAGEREAEIAGNRRFLSEKVNGAVDGFSVPYGSALDYPAPVAAAVRDAGHSLAFLVEGQLNHGPLGEGPILRVSLARTSPVASMLELEVLPRLRRIRDRVSGRTR